MISMEYLMIMGFLMIMGCNAGYIMDYGILNGS
jgi:hypothetical protein